jgi:hypothetical protein
MLFSTCINGHDLTQTDAYVYKDSGLRECRQCVMAKTKPRDTRGGMGWVNHYT